MSSPPEASGFGEKLQRIRTALQDRHASLKQSWDESRQQAAEPEDDRLPDYDDYEDPPLAGLTLQGYRDDTKKKLLTPTLAEELRAHIPSVLQICHSWSLVYSMEQNGMSLNTLYAKSEPVFGESLLKRRGYFIVVMDEQHKRFGAYLNEYLRPQEGRHYYGNGDCFLWTTEEATVKNLSPEVSHVSALSARSSVSGRSLTPSHTVDDTDLRLKVFPYTSVNDFIIYSNHEFISVGSGAGKFGLWIGSDLQNGASDPVDTFGNEQLSTHEKFSIIGLELWKVDV